MMLQIDDFTQFDFVGSRAYDGWTNIAEGGNGGLSLRDTRLSLECSVEAGLDESDALRCAEDAHFILCMRERGGRLASKTEQDAFGTQNYFTDRSFGAHQANVNLRWTDAAAFQSTFKEYW